jgi:GTP-binding protein
MLDKLMADRLRRSAKPVVLVANKADGAKLDAEAAAFYSLGLGEPLPVSAKTGHNRRELLARLMAALPPEGSRERPPQADMTLAIVGKRNAGKSTFINSLAREQRVIVSEVPGTTRDSIDIRVQKDSLVYVLIDTAGIRKRQKVRGNIEFYSRVRAEAAIRRADATLLMIDALLPVSTVDKHLGRFLVEARKPVVLLVNKWDLAKGRATTGEFADYLTRQLPGLEYAPISFISALESRNVEQALDVARGLFKQAHTRVATAEINRAIEEAVRKYKPPAGRGGKLVKLYYGTQVAVDPPTLALFVNSPQNVSEDYARYLSNRFRGRLPFAEVPLRLLFRQSGGPPPEAPDKPRRRERRRAKRL